MPGGDEIGSRPIDLHVRGLRADGRRDPLRARVPRWPRRDGLRGASITLDYPSVGATENLMMAAVRARGTTVIDNAAREPEIADLAEFLVAMGARIEGAGTSTIEIEGVDELHARRAHRRSPDRIEAGHVGGRGRRDARRRDDRRAPGPITSSCSWRSSRDAGARGRPHRRRAPDPAGGAAAGRSTSSPCPYPGVATDFQPILMAMLAIAEGTSIATENVFESRFLYVDELRRMGADIRTEGHHAVIRGVPRLSAAPVRALDIRAGAAMVIAALCADGVTEIADMQHVDRGYEDFEAKLTGARAPRCGAIGEPVTSPG